MAINDYIIKFSSSDDSTTAGYFYKPPFAISERSTNKTSTSLSLFGKYSITYGEDLQTNLVRLLENFSRNVPPTNPTVGQLWFDTGTRLLKVFTPSSTGNVWTAVGSGGSGSTPTLSLATDSTAGVIKTGGAFMVPSSGALTMKGVTYAPAAVTPPSSARYTIDANLMMSGDIYSYDDYNYIAPTPSVPATTFNKYFITKKYADEHYAGLGSGGSGGSSLPVWFPTSSPTKGVFAYDGTNTVWSKSSSANQVLTCTDSAGSLSWETNRSSPSWVPTATPTKGILAYDGTSASWSKGAINQVLTCTDGNGTIGWSTITGSGGPLPVATSLVLGGFRPQRPFIVNGLGDISLEDVEYRIFVPATATDPSIPAQYDFSTNLKVTGEAYSSTVDNNIGVDITRPITDYDNYFVTKKYADDHYASLGAGGSSGPLAIATSTVLGGIKVGAPFTTNATTGELSLAGQTYNSSKVEYTINANLLTQKSLYSSEQDGLVDADNSKPSTYYDSYYITKHYAESKFVKLSGGSGGGGTYVLPTASVGTMGGVKVGDPLTISATGVLSLAKVAYDSAKSEYNFTAAIKSGNALYSTDVHNTVDADTTKPANFYDGYFITKNYADARYSAIGTPGVPGGSSTSIATATVVGGIMIAKPFAVDATGVLQLQKFAFTSEVTANPTATPPVLAAPAEYTVDAAIKSLKWIYSDDDNNTIGLDVSKNYDKYFITKKFADTHYAAIGGGGAGGTNPYALLAANNTTLGGIKVGTPFDMSNTGVLSLPQITYTAPVTANPTATPPVLAAPAEYVFAAAIKSGEFSYSDHIDNKIFSDPLKAVTDYDKYFITKHFADANYVKSSSSYTLPVSSPTVLGGVKVSAPFNVDSSGVLTLPHITLDNANDRYDFDVNIQTKKHILSSDNDNNINKEVGKVPADYDNYFVTKHFADTHYASIGSTGGTPVGFTVVEPLLLTGTAVSLRNVTYDTPHNEYRISANLKTLGSAYSSDLNNNIGAVGVPAADFDYYYTTKKYADSNYLQLGTVFDNTSTSKPKQVLEYATGFTLTDLNGKDAALVTKKYVDDKAVGPTTVSTFADKSVIISSGGTLSEDTKFTYDKTSSTLKTEKVVLEAVTTNTTAALTVYNPTASATSGASVQLFSSPSPVTPAATKPTNPTGTLLGSVKLGGWDGATEYVSTLIEAYSTEDWSVTAHGSRLVISSTKNGAKDPIPALIVQSDNSVVIPGGIVENIYNTNSTTWALDPTQGSMQILSTTANVTITLPAASAFTGKSVSVVVKYSGAHTITWSGTISWESNIVPVPTSLAGTTDIFSFFGDGTKIYGVCSGQAFP
jgi:hypothetical protein